MINKISKETFGIAILGTFISKEEWLPILEKFKLSIIKNEILIPKNGFDIFKEIIFQANKDGCGNDIILIINDENLTHSNYPILCKICSPANNMQNWFDNIPKLPMFWIRDIIQYLIK